RHAPAEQAVNHPPVAVEPTWPDRAPAIWYYPGPGDREAIAVQAKPGDEVKVIVEAAQMVAGDVAVIAVGDLAWRGRERIPDRLASGRRPALDLVTGRRCTEHEAGREP